MNALPMMTLFIIGNKSPKKLLLQNNHPMLGTKSYRIPRKRKRRKFNSKSDNSCTEHRILHKNGMENSKQIITLPNTV